MTTPTSPLATITGTALLPGVSLNLRFYTSDAIGRAVTRAQARIADGGMPLTMRIAHPTDPTTAPVTEIVGRITKVWQEADGRARFTADVADTPEGRTVTTLLDNRAGPPYLKGVSIRGAWLGQTRRVMTDAGYAETADDMEIDGLDYTHKPGVVGAVIEQVTAPARQPQEAAPGRTPIYESVSEARMTRIRETSPDEPVDPVARAAAVKIGQGKWHELSVDEFRAASAEVFADRFPLLGGSGSGDGGRVG